MREEKGEKERDVEGGQTEEERGKSEGASEGARKGEIREKREREGCYIAY